MSALINIFILLFVLTQAIYVMFGLIKPSLWRLGVLVQPVAVLLLLGALGEGHMVAFSNLHLALFMHIAGSLLAHGLLAYAAFAAVAVWVKEAELKNKNINLLGRVLPPLADSEKALFMALILALSQLVLAIVAGHIYEYQTSGVVAYANLKTFTSYGTLAFGAGILWMHKTSGTRGRKAAQYTLVTYLLLLLAYLVQRIF